MWLVEYIRNPNAHQIIEKDKVSALAHLHQVNFIATALEQSIKKELAA